MMPELPPAVENLSVLGDVTRFHAKHRPDKIAMIFDKRSSTYADLDRHANQLANGFAAAGLKDSARVAYFGKNTDCFFEILFAAAKSGMVLVGINWRLAPPEVAYILNDSGAQILFIGREFLDCLGYLQEQCGTLKTIIALEDPEDQIEGYSDWRERQAISDPYLAVDPEATVVQMYTSGTTGHPKGTLLSHRCFFALRRAERGTGAWAEWDDSDKALVATPIFHIGGTGWGFIALYNGGRNIILPEPDPGRMLAAIENHGITKIFVVPALLMMILNHPQAGSTNLSSVKVIVYGASPIPLELLKAALSLFRCEFVQEYGMTEVAGAITYLPAEDHDVAGTQRMASCGKAFPGVELRIVGADGKSLPAGRVGEIWIKTDSLMNGYWNNPEATDEAIVDGWYRSGDAGCLDEDGYLYIRDRVKDMVVSGGENIYPAEVENVLYAHPAVQEVAVIGVPDEKWGEAVKGIVVLKANEEASIEELIAFARERIAGYKVPKSIDFVGELPRNPSGKILKYELRKPYWEGHDRQIH